MASEALHDCELRSATPRVVCGWQAGWTALHRAAAYGFDVSVRVLLKHPGVEVNMRNEVRAPMVAPCSVLWIALGHDAAMIPQAGRTPLHEAVYSSCPIVVDVMLADPRIDVRAVDRVGGRAGLKLPCHAMLLCEPMRASPHVLAPWHNLGCRLACLCMRWRSSTHARTSCMQ